MTAHHLKIISTLNPLIGLCDALTGVGLLLVPTLILQILGTTVAPETLVFVQYIGVFVFAVGLSYFLPYFSGEQLCSRDERILYTWIVTAVIRICVASFVVVQLLLGGLGIYWLLVAVTDASLAAVQFYYIKRVKS